MIILGIESSCDECSMAIVQDGHQVLGQCTASQVRQQAIFEGVVPELASRLHVEWIDHVLAALLSKTKVQLKQVDGIAVTYTPGLLGSLQVGVQFAKGLAMATGLPYIGIDHLQAHLYSCQLSEPLAYPYLGLVLSGGHSFLALCQSPLQYQVLGWSIDDACGEAFDKMAKHFHIGWPGGQKVEQWAQLGDEQAYQFPIAQLNSRFSPYCFSYSGLKTAVIYQQDRFHQKGRPQAKEDVLASFQRVAFQTIIQVLLKLVQDVAIDRIGLGGGVVQNQYFRQMLEKQAQKQQWQLRFPELQYCGDNGAMIAGLAYHYFQEAYESDWDLEPMQKASFKK